MESETIQGIYPRCGISAEGRLFPHVELPKDYRNRVPGFYKSGGKERVEEIVEKIRNSQEMDIKLRWCEELGLTNISLGTHFGFDLDEIIGSFQEHNLDGKFSLAALAIAVTYVNELLRIRTD